MDNPERTTMTLTSTTSCPTPVVIRRTAAPRVAPAPAVAARNRACKVTFYDGLGLVTCDHRGAHPTSPHVNAAKSLRWTTG